MEISVDPVAGETVLCFSAPTTPHTRLHPTTAMTAIAEDAVIEMPHIYAVEEEEAPLEDDMNTPPKTPQFQYTDSDVALMNKYRESASSRSSGLSPHSSFRSNTTEEEVHRYNSLDGQETHIVSPAQLQQPLYEESSLMRSTANRLNDANAWAERKQGQQMIQIPKVKNAIPPSEHLMKPTQARICDIKYREQHKGEIEHKDDIWWEARKPYEKTPCTYTGPSKLLEPTIAYLNSQREKVLTEISGRKRSSGSANVSRSSSNGEGGIADDTIRRNLTQDTAVNDSKSSATKSELKVARIAADSSLLRSTRCTTVSAWGNTPPPRAPQQLQLATADSGPKNVQSKLYEETVSARYQKYQSGPEKPPRSPPLQLAAAKSGPKKVSSKLLAETVTFRNGKYQGKPVVETVEEAPVSPVQQKSVATNVSLGPKNVQSKLYQETAASVAQRAGYTAVAPAPAQLELIASASGPHVPSKLFEETIATRRARYGYHDEEQEKNNQEIAAATEKLHLISADSGPKNVSSKLFEETATSRGWRYKNENASEKQFSKEVKLQLPGARTGPRNVASKLHEETANSKNARFIPKENLPPPPPVEVFKLDLPGTQSGPQNVTSRLTDETAAARFGKYTGGHVANTVKPIHRASSAEGSPIAEEEPYIEF